jgi:hypothetical protein
MRHGYFLPGRGLFGDIDLAVDAQTFWSLSPAGDFLWKHLGHYDGASIWITNDGRTTIRLCLQDFFSEKFRVEVRDWSGISWERAR